MVSARERGNMFSSLPMMRSRILCTLPIAHNAVAECRVGIGLNMTTLLHLTADSVVSVCMYTSVRLSALFPPAAISDALPRVSHGGA